VHVSEPLNSTCLGKAARGKAKAKTGIGKSDFPGLQGGPRKRDFVLYDKVRAPRLYPDPENWFAPLGSSRSGGRGNEAVGASGVEGRLGDLASMQAVT